MTKEQVQKRINEVRDEIEKLREEEATLEKELDEVITDENTESLLNEINDVNEQNSMRVRLYEDTRTTPIMDEFYNSDKRFLVFEGIFSVGKDWTRVSLVVAKGRRNVNLIDSKLTMTDLKKHSGTIVGERFLNGYPETSRFYSLAEEMLKAAPKLENELKVPFETPIRLGGQTYANQTGYGSTYEGTYQVTQGTLYGETTGFYIIGIIAYITH